MPASTEKQARFFEYVEHDPEKLKEMGMTKEQAKDFTTVKVAQEAFGYIKDCGVLVDEQISPNISTTLDGYLLCEGATIARLGVQEYSAEEASASDLPPDENGKVLMIRAREEVFKPESLASFNGKPITFGHPNIPAKGGMIDATSWTQYAKGTVQNVRQEGNLVKADLLITDANTIKQVLDHGIRKLSCGYRSEIKVIEDGLVEQCNIIGNHLALVTNPRAGDVATIVDCIDKNTKPKRSKMSKKMVKDSLLKFLGIVDEAADKIAEEMVDDDSEEQVKEEVIDDDSHEEEEIQTNEEIVGVLKQIITRLEKLEAADKKEIKVSDDDDEDQNTYAVGDSLDKGFLSKVEILTPGYRPTKGDKNPKLSVLKQLSITDSKTLTSLTTKKLDTLSKDSVEMLFDSAVALKRVQNNTRITNTVVDSKPAKADPFAEHYARYESARNS